MTRYDWLLLFTVGLPLVLLVWAAVALLIYEVWKELRNE